LAQVRSHAQRARHYDAAVAIDMLSADEEMAAIGKRYRFNVGWV